MPVKCPICQPETRSQDIQLCPSCIQKYWPDIYQTKNTVMREKCIVELVYGPYSGTEIVFCNQDEDEETIKARAFKQAKADFLPMAYRSAKIVSREPYNGD